MRSQQLAAKCVFFSEVVPDHRWLDSDQQYHALCNYHYEEAIIVYFFRSSMLRCSANLLDSFEYTTLQKIIEMGNDKFVFRNLLAKRNVKNILHFAV